MFNVDYSLSWSHLSTTLGFDRDCKVDIDDALEGFDLAEFWKLIFGSNDCSNPKPHHVHNPTLRFLYYWIIVTLFLGASLHVIGYGEMQLLYAMVNQIKVSPVKMLVHFWETSVAQGKPIGFTSLITRIAESMDLLETNDVEYIPNARTFINEQMFTRIGMLKRGPRGGLKMIYTHHTVEISLSNEKLWLYNVSSLTMRLDRVDRAYPVAEMDRMTRARTRAAQEQAGPSHDAPTEEEVNSMDMSMGAPSHSRTPLGVHTLRPRGRGRRQPRSKMDGIINDMENIHVGQEATLQLVQQNVEMAQGIQTEDQRRWTDWWAWQPPQ